MCLQILPFTPNHRCTHIHPCTCAHTTRTQQPNPVTPRQLSWSDLDSGDGTFSVQPWEEGTSCVFSGCYDNSVERGYPTYWIPETTCTVIESERYQQCVHIWWSQSIVHPIVRSFPQWQYIWKICWTFDWQNGTQNGAQNGTQNGCNLI